MSCHVSIRCYTCKVTGDHSINHGDEKLLALIKLAAPLKALAQTDVEGILDVRLEYESSEPVDFVVKHAGHDMRLCDEYGYDYDKEGKRIEEPS